MASIQQSVLPLTGNALKKDWDIPDDAILFGTCLFTGEEKTGT